MESSTQFTLSAVIRNTIQVLLDGAATGRRKYHVEEPEIRHARDVDGFQIVLSIIPTIEGERERYTEQ